MSFDRARLTPLGWDAHFDAAFAIHEGQGLIPARVAREDLGRYLVIHEEGDATAVIAGRLRHEATSSSMLPAVGDWVVLQRELDGPSRIVALLPRRSAFTRKVPGATTEEQVLAANVDLAFLVSGLDGDFNPRRIERYLTATWESGATPIVVLNKADVAPDLEAQIAEVEAVALGVPVIAISALEAEHLEPLAPWLIPGRTIVLLGSSGVGKSTLANALLGFERQETGTTRAVDAKGRHTTTRRELVALPSGALLIDTPGMRELQLWGDESGLTSAFPEITTLGGACRFRDCKHQSEPGCAVMGAVDAGTLDAARLEAWRKLERELAYLERRRDARAMSEETARWKKRMKEGRAQATRRRV